MYLSKADMADDLARLGIVSGDTVMVHAAVSRIGALINGPDTFIDALLMSVGPEGTIMAYTDWDARYEDLLDNDGAVPDEWRDKIAGFDPRRSRAVRDNGIFPEFLRTTPGALRSANPGASIAAIGAQAGWLASGHALDYGYGEMSPFAKLGDLGGKVLMTGAPLDTMTLIHHAEHRARLSGKRVKRCQVPFATDDGVVWRMSEEFDTSDSIVPALDARDYFTEIVESFLGSGRGVTGKIGQADSVLVDAAPMVAHAIGWIESEAGT